MTLRMPPLVLSVPKELALVIQTRMAFFKRSNLLGLRLFLRLAVHLLSIIRLGLDVSGGASSRDDCPHSEARLRISTVWLYWSLWRYARITVRTRAFSTATLVASRESLKGWYTLVIQLFLFGVKLPNGIRGLGSCFFESGWVIDAWPADPRSAAVDSPDGTLPGCHGSTVIVQETLPSSQTKC